MREIHTFVLRLLVDTDEPQTLRGVLRAVADDEEHPFTDEQALLALLYGMGHATGAPHKAHAGEEDSAKGEARLQ